MADLTVPNLLVFMEAIAAAPRSRAEGCPRRNEELDLPSCAGIWYASVPSGGFQTNTSGRSLGTPEELMPT